jgi:hypothetical protein
VPTSIAVPAGEVAFLQGHAIGTEDYDCLPAGLGFAWSLFTPEATLFNVPSGDLAAPGADKQVITHYFSGNPMETNSDPRVLAAGPIRATWQHKDSSTVWGRVFSQTTDADSDFVAPGAIAWLRVEVKGHQDGPTGGHTLSATSGSSG